MSGTDSTEDERYADSPNEPLEARVHLLAVAALYEGESVEAVRENIERAMDNLPEEIPKDFPDRADAVAPDLTDAVRVVRRWSGESDTFRGDRL